MDAPQGNRAVDLPDGPGVFWLVDVGPDLEAVMSDALPKKKPNKGSFSKGKPGPGRPKGIPNKATGNAREAIAAFVEGNAHRLQGWLDQIASEQGPEKAVRCFMDLLEYHVPKLARTELTGDGGGPVQSQIQVIIQPVKPRD